MSTTPGELYILGIIISTTLSILGLGNIILNWKENKFFGITCLFFASISWQIVLYLSYGTITFDHGVYCVSSFIPTIEEIAITSIEYLIIGGIVAGIVLVIANNKDVSEKLQIKIEEFKSKHINKKEVEIKEEIQPKPVIKKRMVKKKIVKKPIKKE